MAKRMQRNLPRRRRPVNKSVALDRALELLPVIPYIQQQLELALFHRPYIGMDHGCMQHPKRGTSQPRIIDHRLKRAVKVRGGIMCIDRTVKRGTDLCGIRVLALPLSRH